MNAFRNVNACAKLRVCTAVAAPVLAAAFGWTPAAHAAVPGVSLPAVMPPVSASPAVSAVRSITSTVAGLPVPKTPVVAAARHVVTRVVKVVSGTATTKHDARVASAPKTRSTTPAVPKRTVPSRRRHRAVRAPSGRGSVQSGAVHRRTTTSASPTLRLVATTPGLLPPTGFFPGASAGGFGFAVLFVALAAALSALAAPGLGRRLMPSLTDGRDCALTLDLERPD
jgi:hypothetical protein